MLQRVTYESAGFLTPLVTASSRRKMHTLTCSRCLAATYCSGHCQKLHWAALHRWQCELRPEQAGAPPRSSREFAAGEMSFELDADNGLWFALPPAQ